MHIHREVLVYMGVLAVNELNIEHDVHILN